MKNQSLAKGFAVLSAAGMIVKILSFLYIPFLINIIGDEGYGIYYAAYTVYVFIYVLTNSGVPVAISKLVSELVAVENYKDAARSFKIARSMLMAAGILMTILMMALALPISNLVNFPQAYLAILALSPALLFTAVASAYRGYFQGRGNMTPTAVSQIIEQVVNVVFTLLFASLFLRLDYGIAAACAGGTIGTSLGALAASVYLVFYYKGHHKFTVGKNEKASNTLRLSYKQLSKKILSYSIPITLSVGLTYAGVLVDTWNIKSRLLASGLNDSTATILFGYYSKYVQLMNVPIALITSLATAIIPAIAASIASGNHKNAEEKINYALRLCFILALPSAAGLAVLSRPVYSFIKIGDGYKLMTYGAAVIIFMSLVQIQNSVLQSSGKLYNVTVNLFWGIAAKIVVNYFLIAMPAINIYGAVIGSIAGYLIPIILNSIIIKKHLNISISMASIILKPALASVVMALGAGLFYSQFNLFLGLFAVGYVINALSTIGAIFLGAVVYFVVLVLIKGINEEDLSFLPSKIKKLIPGFLFQKIRN